MKGNNKFMRALKSAIKLAVDTGDKATRKILQQILNDEMVLANQIGEKQNQKCDE